MKDRDVLLTYFKDKQGVEYTGKIYYNGELIDVPAGWKILEIKAVDVPATGDKDWYFILELEE